MPQDLFFGTVIQAHFISYFLMYWQNKDRQASFQEKIPWEGECRERKPIMARGHIFSINGCFLSNVSRIYTFGF